MLFIQILGIAILTIVGFRLPKGSPARSRLFTLLKAWVTVFAFYVLLSH